MLAIDQLGYFNYAANNCGFGVAFTSGGYTLKEVGKHYGKHYTTISRIVKSIDTTTPQR